ncbi:DNA cytosine methyltransferase [Streptomyces sp. NPDC006655]|uniref:DNA cytosine methyltransferase n=1 Tax=Streptomyces sp. NPDC006655 TaxID=3156898 RepID=UPI00345404EC
MARTITKKKPRTATHRPAVRPRRFRHDTLTACDLFSGFGGLTDGIKAAGFLVIMAANHKRYKVEVHEANHPEAEHWIADLVDREASDYHSAADLPAADLLVAGISCVNHSQANTQKAYQQGASLFDLDDPDYEARVTRSERDRATATCVLQYADRHRPRMILVECTTELTSWGPAIPGKPKIGDGTTYRWWLQQFGNLGYRHRVLYLNSQFFGVPQSRDRLYIVFWEKSLPEPDLDHRPVSHCHHCDRAVEAVWSWKTGIPQSGSVRYGKQYEYRCPSCHRPVVPPMTPSLAALDLTDLGTRIGDKPVKTFKDGFVGPLARATMARAERCRQRFPDFPAVLMPAKAVHGTERHPWQPMSTQTSQQETSILSTGSLMAAAGNTFERPGSNCRSRGFDEPLWAQTATNTTGIITPPVALAVDNYQGSPRGADTPLPTQVGSETLAVVSAGVIPFRQNTLPTVHGQAMPTVTSDQIPGLLTAAGTIKNNGSIDEAHYRAHPVSDPLGTLVGSAASQSLLFSGWEQNHALANDPMTPYMAEWRAALKDLPLEDCYFRMMGAHEVGRGCGFDVDFPGYKGTFIVWGSARDQVDGFGNAVSWQVGTWIGTRMRASLHAAVAAI